MISLRKFIMQNESWVNRVSLFINEVSQPRRHIWCSARAKRPMTRWTRLSNPADNPWNWNTPCASETMLKDSPMVKPSMVAVAAALGMWWRASIFFSPLDDDLLKLPRAGVGAGVCTTRRAKSAGACFLPWRWLWEDMEILEGGRLLVPWVLSQLVMVPGGAKTGDRRWWWS